LERGNKAAGLHSLPPDTEAAQNINKHRFRDLAPVDDTAPGWELGSKADGLQPLPADTEPVQNINMHRFRDLAPVDDTAPSWELGSKADGLQPLLADTEPVQNINQHRFRDLAPVDDDKPSWERLAKGDGIIPLPIDTEPTAYAAKQHRFREVSAGEFNEAEEMWKPTAGMRGIVPMAADVETVMNVREHKFRDYKKQGADEPGWQLNGGQAIKEIPLDTVPNPSVKKHSFRSSSGKSAIHPRRGWNSKRIRRRTGAPPGLGRRR